MMSDKYLNDLTIYTNKNTNKKLKVLLARGTGAARESM